MVRLLQIIEESIIAGKLVQVGSYLFGGEQGMLE